MKKIILFLLNAFIITIQIFPQEIVTTQKSDSLDHNSYAVNNAFEVESLVPMFFTGGYHFGLGYRYHNFRVRVSVINGGKYNAETAGINNSSDNFKRYYKTSPGIFAGYNVWKGLELYTYLEHHTFEIEQKSTGQKKDLKNFDFGGGISYQYFIGRYFYVQPGAHVYLRKDNSISFGHEIYHISNTDLSLVLRLGIRLWEN